jgi:hypothetical protein
VKGPSPTSIRNINSYLEPDRLTLGREIASRCGGQRRAAPSRFDGVTQRQMSKNNLLWNELIVVLHYLYENK